VWSAEGANSRNQTQDPSTPVSISDESAMDPPALRMVLAQKVYSNFLKTP
jgi:hypothetical protein